MTLEDVRRSLPPELVNARQGYGRSTAVWATVEHHVEPTWWLALSGAPAIDYNTALLHGPDAPKRVPELLARIDEVGAPTVVFLAGEGLAAGQVLSDAGWSCGSAIPLMYGEPRTGALDPRVRLLGEDDLGAARRVVAEAFDIPDESAAALYHAGLTTRHDVLAWGLFDPDLVLCSVEALVGDDAFVGWALATLPSRQRHGYASSYLRHIDEWHHRHTGRRSLLLGTNASARLYANRGHPVLEHWQLWSKPRWVLGS